MKANKKDNFKNIIKLAGNDIASADFTDTVMKTIEADVAREHALKAVLQKHPAEGPALNFAANIMAQLDVKAKHIAYQPIISKSAWYGMAAVIAVFLLLIGLSNPQTAVNHKPGAVSRVLQYVDAIPMVYIMTFILVGILLFTDYLITQRRKKSVLV